MIYATGVVNVWQKNNKNLKYKSMKKEEKEEIENQLKKDYKSGELLKKCDACGREIELWEKVFDYGGKICKECFEDVGRNLK